ncbi:wax ester/triacylglycerol synthase family O-acyltransferase [Williamsia maris]|nr:wax ester/triacylglycerol synthase family O-acyltransferase [Williamsia maris]
MAGLERFNTQLGAGRLGRRIEKSAFPWARDRWVDEPSAPAVDIDSLGTSEEVAGWVDRRASIPIDPWAGPAWHIGVLPVDDGSTVVTLVASHALVDGVGMALATADAAASRSRSWGYRPPRTRGAFRGFLHDGLQTVREIPKVFRALVSAVGLMRTRLRVEPTPEATAPTPQQSSAGSKRSTAPPERRDVWAVARVRVNDVAVQARERGGTDTTLLCGVATQLAADLGWVNPLTGESTVALSVNQRTSSNDARANALTEVQIDIDPAAVTIDLSGIRSDLRTALVASTDHPHEFDRLLPLTPFLPKKLFGALIEAPADLARPVTTCAGLGTLDPGVFRPDGSPADTSWFRLTWAALPGRTPIARRQYLYFGWTGSEHEFAVFAATNLRLPGTCTWDQLLDNALERFSLSTER